MSEPNFTKKEEDFTHHTNRMEPLGENTYRITKIEVQKNRKDRVNVFLDDGFAFGLDQEVVLRHHLHEGDALSESLIGNILLAEEKARAKEKALSYLGYRARSAEELKKKLLKKGFSDKTIQAIVDDFRRVGLLDDRQFAETYVHSRMIQKPMGKRLLRKELLSKGIDEEMIDRAIEEAYGNRCETEVAKDLIQKKLQSTHSKEKESKIQKKKLTDFLLRRGFDWEVISEVFQEEPWEKAN